MYKIIIDLLPVLLLAIILWLGGLSFLTWQIQKYIKKISKGVKPGNLLKMMDELIKIEQGNKKEIGKIFDEIKEIKIMDQEHFQRVGLVRFNPFNETGGDHSFSLCLLDDKHNGFIISCLHARDRTRVYAKPILSGNSTIKLSQEERKSLTAALK